MAQLGSPILWGVPTLVVLVALTLLARWLTRNPRMEGTLLLAAPYPHRPQATKKLRGRWARFNPETLPGVKGCGLIKASWVKGHGSAMTELIVTYWPLGEPHRKVTRSIQRGKTLIINGARFHWVPLAT